MNYKTGLNYRNILGNLETHYMIDNTSVEGINSFYNYLIDRILETKLVPQDKIPFKINDKDMIDTGRDSITVICKYNPQCNQNCFYCYEKNKHYDSKPTLLADEAIINFINKLLLNTSCIYWVWQGGEFLLNDKQHFDELMFKIIQLLNHNPDKQIVFSVQTNATLLDDEWYKLFDKYNVSVSISGDGPNNKLSRGYEIEDKWLRKVPHCITVLNKYNYENLIDIYKYQAKNTKLHLTSFNFCRMTSLNKNVAELLHINIDTIIQSYKNFIHYYLGENDDLLVERGVDSLISLVLGLPSNGINCNLLNCLDYDFICLDNEGKIGKCDDTTIGDLYLTDLEHFNSYDDIIDIVENKLKPSFNHSDKCNDCDIYPFCSYGCLAARLLESNGNLEYEFHCKLMKEIVPYIYNELKDLSPADMMKLSIPVRNSLLLGLYLPETILEEKFKGLIQ